jgi:hypothetical protein
MPGGDLNRLVEARALDDVEAAHLFFGFGERAIGYQQLAVADADGAGIAARSKPRAAAPDPRASTSASQAWVCSRACTSAGLKITDSSSQIISMYFMALLPS